MRANAVTGLVLCAMRLDPGLRGVPVWGLALRPAKLNAAWAYLVQV